MRYSLTGMLQEQGQKGKNPHGSHETAVSSELCRAQRV